MPSWHLHRQLALLTHLEHPVEDHCDRCWWSSLPLLGLVRFLQALLHPRYHISFCIVWSVADFFFLVSHCLPRACSVPGDVSCSCRVAHLRCPELVSFCLRQAARPGLCSPVGTHRGPDKCHCWLWGLRRHGFLMALHDEPEPVCDCGFESIIVGTEGIPDFLLL